MVHIHMVGMDFKLNLVYKTIDLCVSVIKLFPLKGHWIQ